SRANKGRGGAGEPGLNSVRNSETRGRYGQAALRGLPAKDESGKRAGGRTTQQYEGNRTGTGAGGPGRSPEAEINNDRNVSESARRPGDRVRPRAVRQYNQDG